MGRPGLVEGTRELLEWPYIIVYKVFEDREEVVVLSVVHGARDREEEQCVMPRENLVLPVRIELTTSPLPRECSTTELRQQTLIYQGFQ